MTEYSFLKIPFAKWANFSTKKFNAWKGGGGGGGVGDEEGLNSSLLTLNPGFKSMSSCV
jgi:hypothetical protein